MSRALKAARDGRKMTMDMKRFIGPDMRTTLRMVREQLGPDAVILSNRRVAGGIEITAGDGADFGVAAAATAAVPPSREPPAAQAPAFAQAARAEPTRHALQSPVTPAAPSAEFFAVRGELRELRALMERQLGELRGARDPWGPGVEGLAWRQFTRAALPNDVVQALVSALGDEPDAEALPEILARVIPEAGDVVARGGVFAAVGPTGAGKTTTLCKLAVRHVLAHGPGSLVLASADSARLGGADMLRAAARLLDVPFIAAADGESISSLLARAGNPGLLLLDTPGLSRRRSEDAVRLQELAGAGVHSLLVLPANAQLAWLDSAVGDYRAARPVAAVVTKIDETVSLGEAVGVILREGLPLAYLTDGPEIPDDLHVGSASDIARRTLALGEALDVPSPRAARPAVRSTIAARIA
jgi:flagellar biosynthesis protein FlhF